MHDSSDPAYTPQVALEPLAQDSIPATILPLTSTSPNPSPRMGGDSVRERVGPRARRPRKQHQQDNQSTFADGGFASGTSGAGLAAQDDFGLRLENLEALVGRLRLAFLWEDTRGSGRTHEGPESDQRGGNRRGYRGRGGKPENNGPRGSRGSHRKWDQDGRGSVPSFRSL